MKTAIAMVGVLAACSGESHTLLTEDGGGRRRDGGPAFRDVGSWVGDAGPCCSDGGPVFTADAGVRSCGGAQCTAGELCCALTASCVPEGRRAIECAAPDLPPDTGDGAPCASDRDCASGQFCRVLGDGCAGAGRCWPVPGGGTIHCDGWAPVCGCDGRSYDSVCAAYAGGTSVSRAGMLGRCGERIYPHRYECDFERSETCPFESICDPATRRCVDERPVITCGRDSDCPFGDVCCARSGICVDPSCEVCCATPPPGTSIPCRDDRDCRWLDMRGDASTFCWGSGCDSGGGCLAPPTSCGGELSPVCGCNGTTYSNECWARAARTRVAHAGACP